MSGPDNLLDPVVAKAALDNPATSPTDLSLIAQHQPALRAAVAMHPSAYPGLLDWLDGLGDPVLSAVVKLQRQPTAPAPSPQQLPYATQPAAQPVAPQAYVPQPTTAQPPGATWPAPFAAPGEAAAPAAPTRRPTRLLVGLGVGVLSVALVVAGFATHGFGLLPVGGAATPEEEGLKVANQAIQLVNSFSAKNLLDNPLSAIGSLGNEYAPSEARLVAHSVLGQGSANTTVDVTDLLGITGDSVGVLTDLVGSFHVEATGLKTDATELTDDIAVVRYTEGTVTVTADIDKLRATLQKAPDVASRQLTATAEKYGLHPAPIALEDQLPQGWLDEAIDSVRDRFPVTMDLAAYHRALRNGTESPDPQLATAYQALAGVIVVREGGRWYLSSMLTGYASSRLAGSLDEIRPTTDRKRMLSVEPARNGTAAEAAEALAGAISSGRERSVLAQLPLAERRYAAFTGLLAQLGSMDTSGTPDTKFTEIARNGDHAKLRIDTYDPVYVSYGEPVSITDGTCVTANGTTACLSDYLDPGRLDDAFDTMRNTPWGSFQDTTGIAPAEIVDKLETATDAAVRAIHADQVGVVAVQEDGSWFVSASATVGDLQYQAAAALVEGLKTAQNR